MMHLIQSKANSNAFIPNSLHFLFCFSFSQWMWLNKLMESILRSGARNLLFLQRNFNFPFNFFITFNPIGACDIDLSNTRLIYVYSARCAIFIFLYLIFNLRIFSALHLLGKRIQENERVCFQFLPKIFSLKGRTQTTEYCVVKCDCFNSF